MSTSEKDLAALHSYYKNGGWLVYGPDGLMAFQDPVVMRDAGMDPAAHAYQPKDVRWYRITPAGGVEMGEYPGRSLDEARLVMDYDAGVGLDHPCRAGKCSDEDCGVCLALSKPVVGFLVQSDNPERVTVERPSDTCGPRCHPDCDGH